MWTPNSESKDPSITHGCPPPQSPMGTQRGCTNDLSNKPPHRLGCASQPSHGPPGTRSDGTGHPHTHTHITSPGVLRLAPSVPPSAPQWLGRPSSSGSSCSPLPRGPAATAAAAIATAVGAFRKAPRGRGGSWMTASLVQPWTSPPLFPQGILRRASVSGGHGGGHGDGSGSGQGNVFGGGNGHGLPPVPPTEGIAYGMLRGTRLLGLWCLRVSRAPPYKDGFGGFGVSSHFKNVRFRFRFTKWFVDDGEKPRGPDL